jgi:hypothetical protein
MLCGVTSDATAITTLRRVGALGATVGSPTPDGLAAARAAVRARLDDMPLLLPRGAAAALRARRGSPQLPGDASEPAG